MNKRRLYSWRLISLAAVGLLSVHQAKASCISAETLDDAIDKANIIFIATIVQSQLDVPLESLKDRQEFRVTYKFAVRKVIRGEPALIQEMYSDQLYHDTHERKWTMGAERSWNIGDSVLVVAEKGPSVSIGACSWSAPYEEMREEVRNRGWDRQ